MQRTYSSQNSFKKQKQKPPEDSMVNLFLIEILKPTTWGKGSFQQIVSTQLDIHMGKNEPLPYKVQELI